jgi:diguanylate cyclase (GGDEF)-like protein
MPPAPVGPHEAQRLNALHDLAILDTPPTEVFNSFVRVARGLFDAPVAAVSLVDTNRQWFKAVEGLSFNETTRDTAFCAHTILKPDQVMCVPDTQADSRFADNPHVTGQAGIRFYAGAPLVNEDGHALGALCVVDTRPRVADPVALARLRDLATGVMAALRLHGALRQLSDEVRCDPLTGLLNRRAFDEALRTLDRGAGTLFVLDLDKFRSVNDTFGHTVGNAALREAARRLRGLGSQAVQVFRLGGDAFAVVAEGPRDEAASLALAAEMHAGLADPFLVDGHPVPLRASIGIAATPHHANHADRLFAAADAALYDAKLAGRGTTRMAQPRGRHRSRDGNAAMGRILMKERLREALLAPRVEQFALHFQPVLDLHRGRVAAHEALVRWMLPDGRRIGPAQFVPAAEASGLVSHLDRWVLQQACDIAVRWPVPWRVSVNISPVTFGVVDVVGLVRDALDSSALPPDRLVIEVTETAPVAEPERMVEIIHALRRLGVLPIVDDFGSGHASLAYLRHYPFEFIKTDRCFIAGLDKDPRATPIMDAMVRLTRSLEMTMVAEGVETEEQLMVLHRLGVPRVQGYFLGRPVPADQVERTAERAERKLARVLKRHGKFRQAAAARDAVLGQTGWPSELAYRQPLLA